MQPLAITNVHTHCHFFKKAKRKVTDGLISAFSVSESLRMTAVGAMTFASTGQHRGGKSTDCWFGHPRPSAD